MIHIFLLPFTAQPNFGKELRALTVYFLTSHSHLNPLQSGFHLQRATKTAQAKITNDPHVSKSRILNRVANLKVDFMIYMSATRSNCCPPGCADVGKLPSELWFPFACCTQRRTSITRHNSRMNRGSLLLMQREVINQQDLITANETRGKPAL